MIGSSVALAISDIPWDGPTGSVQVGRVDGRMIINPSLEQREKSDIHMTVSGTKEAIMMVEAGASEVPEMEMLDAILFAHEEIKSPLRSSRKSSKRSADRNRMCRTSYKAAAGDHEAQATRRRRCEKRFRRRISWKDSKIWMKSK